jgi:hypothetical protein
MEVQEGAQGLTWAYEFAWGNVPGMGWRWTCTASPRFESREEAQRWVDEGPLVDVGPEDRIGKPARTIEGKP